MGFGNLNVREKSMVYAHAMPKDLTLYRDFLVVASLRRIVLLVSVSLVMISFVQQSIANAQSSLAPSDPLTLHKNPGDIPIIRYKQEPLKRLLQLGPPLLPRQPRRRGLANIQEKVRRPSGRDMQRVEFLAREKVAHRVGELAECCAAHRGEVEQRRDREWFVRELRGAICAAVALRLNGEHFRQHRGVPELRQDAECEPAGTVAAQTDLRKRISLAKHASSCVGGLTFSPLSSIAPTFAPPLIKLKLLVGQ